MDFIIWRDSFNTNYHVIDEQHRELVRIINMLFKTIGTKNNGPEIKQIFLELFDYTLNHFGTEETIMQQMKFAKFNRHKEEHNQFKMKLKEFKVNYLAGNAKVNGELLKFLKDWLLNHIMKEDKATFTITCENEFSNTNISVSQ